MEGQTQSFLFTSRFKGHYHVLAEITAAHVDLVIDGYPDVHGHLLSLQRTFDFPSKKQSLLLEGHEIGLLIHDDKQRINLPKVGVHISATLVKRVVL